MSENVEGKGRPSRTEVIKPLKRGLEFADPGSFDTTLGLLLDLGSTGPIEFQPLGDGEAEPFAVILPEWSYARLEPLLGTHTVEYTELEVRPISDLPPEAQARLRGLLRDETRGETGYPESKKRSGRKKLNST